jgi:hypothetical protein
MRGPTVARASQPLQQRRDRAPRPGLVLEHHPWRRHLRRDRLRPGRGLRDVQFGQASDEVVRVAPAVWVVIADELATR